MVNDAEAFLEEGYDVEDWYNVSAIADLQNGDWESPLGIRMDGRLDGWIYLKKHLNVVNDSEACLEEEAFLEEDDYDGEECLEYDA